MFHQVRVTEDQKHLLGFRWWPDGELSQPLKEYQMNVHLFGACSSPSCSNFSLRRSADDFGGDLQDEPRNVLKRNFYVDDCLRSEPTEEKAIKRIEKITNICAQGGFRLTKFISNRRSVLQSPGPQSRPSTHWTYSWYSMEYRTGHL